MNKERIYSLRIN
uniref:Uncharacterized protein n=1 Tax=Lepeophtheirus salmonis TaxID=72036 RepID=A0A0K2U610_LEPSM